MADRVAQFIIGFGGDASDLDKVFAGIRTSVDRTVLDLKRATEKLDLFGDIERSLPGVQRSLDAAKAKVVEYSVAIEKAQAVGGKVPRELIDGLKQAESAAASATKELARQQQQLATLDVQLTRSGVNTKNLAAEQIRLAEASKAASAAAEVQAAKQTLGLTTLKDTEAQAAKLRAAFDTLKNSGTLSASETAAAQRLLGEELKKLSGSVNVTGSSFLGFAKDAKASFSEVALKVTAVTTALAGIGAAAASVIGTAREFNNALAQVGTITTLGKEGLAGLGLQARQLSQEIGIGAVDALHSLYEVIRSGVPAENSIEVLRKGAEAAKASFTDTATGAKAATLLIDAFGVDLKDLGGALDIVVRSAQTGGPTLKEFAETAGGLGNAARAAGLDFKDVSAVLNVMTDASNDAAGSIALLAKVLINLAKPEVKDALHRLNLDGLSLVDTFRGLTARGFKVDEFLQLGIAGTKAAVGLAALINNADKLPKALDEAAKASGTVEKATTQLADTAEERAKRLNAAYEESKRIIGEVIGAQSELAVVGAKVLKFLNDDYEATKRAAEAADKFAAENRAAILDFLNYGGALDNIAETATKASAPVAEFHQGLVDAGAAAAKATKDIAAATERLQTNSRSLEQLTPIVQRAVADQVDAIRARAQTEIDLLDKSLAKQVETAQKATAIQAQANADILKAVQDGQKLVTQTVDAAIQARAALERKRISEGKGNEEKYNQDVSKIRLDAAQTDLANVQKFEKQLIDQRTATQGRLNAIEQSRVAFNEQIELSIRDARVSGLSGLEQFAQRQLEVDKLITKAREIAATQGIQAAEKYFSEAERLSGSLKGEVQDDGVVVVSALQGQETAVKKLTQVRDAYNQASDTARAKEQRDLGDTTAKLKTVGETVTDLETRVRLLRKETSEAIELTIASDIRGIDAAAKKLDDLTRDRTVTVGVNVVRTNPDGSINLGGLPPIERNQGGPVRREYAQRYAAGGLVFNRPTWSKVPGIGDRDTQPALLQEGAFVVRKAASQFYGDSAMARLVRGYAGGGFVGFGGGSQQPVSQVAADLKDFFRKGDKKLTPEEINKLGQYLTSLPQAEQDRLQHDIALGGTDAVIAQGEIADGAATQARGAPVNLAPADISPTPSATEATTYGRYVESHLKFGGIMDLIKRSLGNDIRQVERRPNDAGLIQELIRTARAAAANNWLEVVYGKTVFGGTNTSFKNLKDWYDFDREQKQSGPVGPFHGVDFRNIKFGFAGGGPVGDDVVPAMLTPGETVLRPEVTRVLGSDLLNAVNQMRIPPAALSNVLERMRPPAPPRYFATGGIVPGTSVPERGTTTAGAAGDMHFHFHGVGTDFTDPRVQRRAAEGIREQMRRCGQTL